MPSVTTWTLTSDNTPSDKCHVCSRPITGSDADVLEGHVVFDAPGKPFNGRLYGNTLSVPLTERIRRHFLLHKPALLNP